MNMMRPEGLLALRTSGPGQTNLFDVGGSNIILCSEYTKGPHSVEAFSVYGAPGRIRTSDHLVRSQVLYPAELRALISLEGEF